MSGGQPSVSSCATWKDRPELPPSPLRVAGISPSSRPRRSFNSPRSSSRLFLMTRPSCLAGERDSFSSGPQMEIKTPSDLTARVPTRMISAQRACHPPRSGSVCRLIHLETRSPLPLRAPHDVDLPADPDDRGTQEQILRKGIRVPLTDHPGVCTRVFYGPGLRRTSDPLAQAHPRPRSRRSWAGSVGCGRGRGRSERSAGADGMGGVSRRTWMVRRVVMVALSGLALRGLHGVPACDGISIGGACPAVSFN